MAPPLANLAAPPGIAADTAGTDGSPGVLAQQLQREPARWQQATDNGDPRPVDAALIDWLNLLAREVQAADTSATPPTAPAAPVMPGQARVLVLLREGQWAHRFVVDGAQLQWEHRTRGTRLLVLSPEALRRLADRWP